MAAPLSPGAQEKFGWITFPDYTRAIREDGTSLWEDKWPIWALQDRKNIMGPIAWAQEMENNPIPEDNSYFTLSKFEACYRAELKFEWEYRGGNPVFIGVDSQVSLKSGADFGCIFVIEFLPDTEHRRILWIERGRWGFRVADIIEEFYHRYQPTEIIVENNGAQDFILQHLKNPDNTVMPLNGFTTGENKPDILIGIPYLAATVDVEKWIIPRGGPDGIKEKELTDQWVKECLEYGQGHSGDVLMGSWFANDGARKLSRLGLTNLPSPENASFGEREFKSDHAGTGDVAQSSFGPRLGAIIEQTNSNRNVFVPPRQQSNWSNSRGRKPFPG